MKKREQFLIQNQEEDHGKQHLSTVKPPLNCQPQYPQSRKCPLQAPSTSQIHSAPRTPLPKVQSSNTPSITSFSSSPTQSHPLQNAVTGMSSLWIENLQNSGQVTSQEDYRHQVEEHRKAAENIVHNIEALGVSGKVESHIGVPQNLAEWSDLLAEAALLPKPALHTYQTMSHNFQQQQQSQSSLIQNSIQNRSSDAKYANSSDNRSRVLTNRQQQITKSQEFALNALKNESFQKWLQIRWCTSAEEAVKQATARNRPIFVEIVVGRLADKTSNIC